MAVLPRLLPDASWKARVVVELRGDERLAGWIDVAWDGNVQYASRPRVRYLATKLEAIDFLLGVLDEEPTAPLEGDQAPRASARRSNLLAVRVTVLDALKRVRVSRGGAVLPGVPGTIIPSPVFQPALPVWGDAFDTVYIGDPNKRPWGVQQP